MKFGILGSKGYPNLQVVQNYVSYLSYIYRPFAGYDEEYDEHITLLTELNSHLDCTAVIQAGQEGFAVEQVKDTEELLNKADKVIVFWDGDCEKVREVINFTLDNTIHLEVIYPKESQ